jgi:ATP:ADP antiporter, AAA family
MLLEISVWIAALLSRRFDQLPGARATDREPGSRAIIGGNAWSGIMHVVRSPYLMAICTYILLTAVALTFLYFTQLHLVDSLGGTRDQNTRVFANIELWAQIATLVLQAFVAGYVMKRLGVGLALALLPMVTAAGLLWLAAVPALGAFVLVQAMFRAAQRAIARPARETLFTVVKREDKYKAKSLIDTFVHRGGDVVGAQLQQAIAPGLLAVSAAIIPMAMLWAALSFYLGYRQRQLAVAAETQLAQIDTSRTEPGMTAKETADVSRSPLVS